MKKVEKNLPESFSEALPALPLPFLYGQYKILTFLAFNKQNTLTGTKYRRPHIQQYLIMSLYKIPTSFNIKFSS